MALTLVEQSLMFSRRKPRTLFAFPAVIAVCLDHVRLQWLRRQGIYLCRMFIAFCYGWHTMFHGTVWFLWHYSDGCALSWIKFHLPVFLPLFQWWQIWLESLLVSVSSDALKEEAVIWNSLVWEEHTTFGRSLIYKRKRRGSKTVPWGTKV